MLDTWFSSALWPHSTLGWPDETPELEKYYPTSVLSTARDIITLWVARMVIFGLFNRGDVPFRDVYIHPMIQDGQGKRMSKSAGNGVDPVDIIEIYGADALRYTLAAGATETQDLRIPVEPLKLPDGRVDQHVRAVRAGAKLRQQVLERRPARLDEPRRLRAGRARAAKRCRSRIAGSSTAWTGRSSEVTSALEQFQFAEAARQLRDFTWGDFCDWYLEFVKGRLRDPTARPVAQRVLAALLDGLCRLLHPIMPFVTEQVWQGLNGLAPVRGLPEPARPPRRASASRPGRSRSGWSDETARQTVDQWCEAIKAIRNLKAERNVPKDAKIAPIIVAQGTVAEWLRQGEPFLRSLLPAESVTIVASIDRPAECAVAVLPEAEIILPLEGLIDKEAERAKHAQEPGRLRAADRRACGQAGERVIRGPGAGRGGRRRRVPSSPSSRRSATPSPAS